MFSALRRNCLRDIYQLAILVKSAIKLAREVGLGKKSEPTIQEQSQL